MGNIKAQAGQKNQSRGVKRTTDAFSAFICRETDNPAAVHSFLAFRKRFFVDNLGWKLSTQKGIERDMFDTADAVYCVLRASGAVIGGWRAIPTNRPYLALSRFPELAASHAYPRRADIWEISRFGQMKQDGCRARAGILYALMFQFAVKRQAGALVAVADLFHERLLHRVGIKTRRYGPPRTIARDRQGRAITVVAGEIPVHDQKKTVLETLLAMARKVEVIDETLVLRSDRISA